jgi:hypothetical protein
MPWLWLFGLLGWDKRADLSTLVPIGGVSHATDTNDVRRLRWVQPAAPGPC